MNKKELTKIIVDLIEEEKVGNFNISEDGNTDAILFKLDSLIQIWKDANTKQRNISTETISKNLRIWADQIEGLK